MEVKPEKSFRAREAERHPNARWVRFFEPFRFSARVRLSDAGDP